MDKAQWNYSHDSECPKCGADLDLLDSTKEGELECPTCGVELITRLRFELLYVLAGYFCAAIISYLLHLQSVFFFLGVVFFGFALSRVFQGALPELLHLPYNITEKQSGWLKLN